MKITLGQKVIDVYKTISNEYRAYVVGDPNTQAWDVSELGALIRVGKSLGLTSDEVRSSYWAY